MSFQGFRSVLNYSSVQLSDSDLCCQWMLWNVKYFKSMCTRVYFRAWKAKASLIRAFSALIYKVFTISTLIAGSQSTGGQ